MTRTKMVHKNKILVTGANGFIGGRIVEKAFLDGVGDVVAGIHNLHGAARVARFPVSVRLCDITDAMSLPDLLEDIDIVVHTAYGSKYVNEQGTANMLEAARKARVKLFIHFSTVEVYGSQNGVIDETSSLLGTGEYGESKVNAERICGEYAEKGLPVVVLRPGVVYGPFSRPWTIRLAERFASGQWQIPAGMTGVCAPVYIDDVVNATFLAMNNRQARGEAFNVASSEVVSWVDFFSRFNASLGLPPLQIADAARTLAKAVLMTPVRVGAKFALGKYPEMTKKILSLTPALKRFAKQSESAVRTSVSLEELAVYRRSAIYSIEKASKILGYEPRFELDQGLALTAAWAKLQGYLPSKIEELGY